MDSIFFALFLMCIYSYFLYPLILLFVPGREKEGELPGDSEILPALTLIITVHNEEQRIREKLENSQAIDYPDERLEIIVASDCSDDSTDDIVREWRDHGVSLVRADRRNGKEYAQLCAIREAAGDILVFSDVATRIPEDGLRNLMKHFGDPRIGAVSSVDRFVSNDGHLVGEGAYVRYEMWLRRLESGRAGLVGLSGSFFAARRSICEHWDINSPSDFTTALNCAKLGMIAVSAEDVVGIYKDVSDPRREYQRKMRTVIRGITAVTRHPEVLNPFAMKLFAFQVWSHKIMRWAVPWFLLLFAVLTLVFANRGPVFQVALVLQLVFYGMAVAGWLSHALREKGIVKIVFFFVQTNLALAQAMLAWLGGKRMTVWTPSQR